MDAAPVIAPGNTEQSQFWNGAMGQHWVAHEDRVGEFPAFDERLLQAAAIRPGERVLDVGCGIGTLTRRLAREAAGGEVLGLDISTVMLDRARARLAETDLENLTFALGDAQVHPLPPAHFDVLVSRFGVMFFADPLAAFAHLARALRPGGRLAILTWASAVANEWVREMVGAVAVTGPPPLPPPGAPGPFSLDDAERVINVLQRAGFTCVRADPVQADMWVGTDVESAIAVQQPLLARVMEELTDDQRRLALDRLRVTLEQHQDESGIHLGAAAWLFTGSRAVDEA